MPQELLKLATASIRVSLADSYRLPRAESESRLSDLLEEWPLPSGARFGCYLIPHRSRYSDLAREVECTVFERFFGNTPKCMADAYGEYEASSMFLVVVDQEQRCAAGALRIILPSARGLKTVNDIAEAPPHISAQQVASYHHIEDPRRCWDIGSVAVLKDYRAAATDHTVSLMLYGQLHTLMLRRGVEHMVTVLDKHAFTQLTEALGVPIVPIAGGEPFSYLGSDISYAGYMHVPHMGPSCEDFVRSLKPEMQPVIRPYISRLLYLEGMTELVEVQEDVERTGRVAIARLTR